MRFFVFILTLGLLFGEALNAAEDQSLEQIRLQLKWTHQFQFAGYYAAVEQGYYREEGLEVELVEADGSIDPMMQVIEGKAEYGVSTSDLVVLRSHGFPVVALAVIYQHSPLVLLARKDARIDALHDLVGKRVMLEAHAADLEALLKDEQIEPGDFVRIPHNFGVDSLIEGRVDAISAYTTDEPWALKEAKVAFYTFSPRASGIDFYGDGLFTTEKEIKNHPERVKAFRRASLRGWAYAMTNREEIVDLILSKYNQGKSRDHLLFEAEKTYDLVFPEIVELGYMNPGRWKHIIETFNRIGLLTHPVEVKDILYDPGPEFPWKLILLILGLGSLVIVSVGAIAGYFRILNLRYLRELEMRQETERMLKKANEELALAGKAKDRFLANVSHEIRNPMNSMLGLVQLLEDASLKKEDLELLKTLEESTRSLILLLNEILDFSKIGSEGEILEKDWFPFRNFIQESVQIYEPFSRQKGVPMEIQIKTGAAELVFGDARLLKRVLLNLLSNALKFTEEGKILCLVHPLNRKGSLNQQRIDVIDTGIGISKEQTVRIFMPYIQANRNIEQRFGGTGLGLAISKQIMARSGGLLTVESVEGQGSNFTMIIEWSEN